MKAWLSEDSGYSTVLTAGIIAALTTLLLAVAGVGSLVAARHEAQVAADLAAVAGAWGLAEGKPACPIAGRTADLNGARLVQCQVEGRDVIATTRVRGREAIAQAGPV